MVTYGDKILLIKAILTNSLDGNIYSWKSNPDEPIIELFLKFANERPQILAEALTLFSKHGVIRNVGFYALAALSRSNNKSSFRQLFSEFIKNADDVFDFANILNDKKNRKFGFALSAIRQRLLTEKLNLLSERELLPYINKKGKGNPKDNREDKSDPFRLKDLIHVLHARHESPFLQAVFQSKFGDNIKLEAIRERLPLSWALKQLKSEKDPTQIIRLIKDNRLEWEWVISRTNVRNPEILLAIVEIMPPHEVIKRIDSIIKFGCISIPYGESLIISKIRAASSKHYESKDPSRFYLAFRNLNPNATQAIFSEMAGIINQATHSEFEGLDDKLGLLSVAVFVDCSESMSIKRSTAGYDSPFRPSIFENALFHAMLTINSFPKIDRYLYLFGEDVKKLKVTGDLISDINVANTTRKPCFSDISLPLTIILSEAKPIDLIFILTDYDFDHKVLQLWQEYRNKINNRAILIFVQLKPFSDRPIELPQGFYKISEWNDRTAGLINNALYQEE